MKARLYNAPTATSSYRVPGALGFNFRRGTLFGDFTGFPPFYIGPNPYFLNITPGALAQSFSKKTIGPGESADFVVGTLTPEQAPVPEGEYSLGSFNIHFFGPDYSDNNLSRNLFTVKVDANQPNNDQVANVFAELIRLHKNHRDKYQSAQQQLIDCNGCDEASKNLQEAKLSLVTDLQQDVMPDAFEIATEIRPIPTNNIDPTLDFLLKLKSSLDAVLDLIDILDAVSSQGSVGNVTASGTVTSFQINPFISLFDLNVTAEIDGGFLSSDLIGEDYITDVSLLSNPFALGVASITDITTAQNLTTLDFRLQQIESSSLPLPEPTSLVLLGFGLASLGFATRRRRTGKSRPY